MVNRFETEGKRYFENLGLDYYALDGQQISLRDIHPTAPIGDSLEFDGFILSGRTCVIVELTEEKRSQREKVRRFIQHASWFENSPHSVRSRFAIFKSIPRGKLRDFEDVNEWRYLFVGTSPELRENNLRPNSFPECKGRLGILWDEDWAYLKLLQRSIGVFAKGELFASLDLQPGHSSGASAIILSRSFITLDRKVLAPNMPKAQLFVTTFSAEELLDMCRVLRYQRLPMAVEAEAAANASTGYQRLLGEAKLKSIRELIQKEPKTTFPNALTLVSSDCYVQNDMLHVPYKYASLDVIDGQHRLFAYAGSELKESLRKQAQLFVTIIKFEEDSLRCAARVFVTINKNQAKVKRELIVLTAYDAMGAADGEAVAGKVLSELNEKKNFALYSKLRTRPMIRADGTMPIVTIALELARILESSFLDSLSEDQRQHFCSEFTTSVAKFRKREERLRLGKQFMSRIANQVKSSFPSDFASGDSSLLSPIFIACFIRVARKILIDEMNTWDQLERKIKKLAKNAIYSSGNALAFPIGVEGIPEKKSGMKTIVDYLAKCLP
jgi:DGQHR domain-containing protein